MTVMFCKVVVWFTYGSWSIGILGVRLEEKALDEERTKKKG
jgi:hypothetical protein